MTIESEYSPVDQVYGVGHGPVEPSRARRDVALTGKMAGCRRQVRKSTLTRRGLHV